MKKRVYINAATAISPNGIKDDSGILYAVEPDYKAVITNANLRRRMSRIVKMGVACGLLCLQQNDNKPADAIITATGLGCLTDTEKFLRSIIENNEQLLNPTAFIQSTFNVVGAQIALLTNNQSYNNTFVHRGLSFESALIDGMMRINEGDSNVLVGAIDEATPTLQIILQRLGLLRDSTLGEGAQFFILSNKKKDANSLELKEIKTYSGKLSSEEMVQHITSLLHSVNVPINNVGYLLTGDNGNSLQAKTYDRVRQLFPAASHHTFKDTCGEYPTASSYALYVAVSRLAESLEENSHILICNSYNSVNHSLILLQK